MKSTKRALLTSGFCLMLTALMLMGSTFAWFTDSVTSTGNKIQTGKLDIGVIGYRLQGNEWGQAIWENQLASSPLITETNWEPGQYGAVLIRVSSDDCTVAAKVRMDFIASGDLAPALWYRLEAVQTTNASYEPDMLAKLQYKDSRPAFGDNDVTCMTEIGNDNTKELTLYPEDHGGQYAYYLLEYGMYTDMGSDYQKKSFSLNFTVKATQAAEETDGFGNNDYDADAEYAVSATNENFAETIRNATPGTTVLLTEDVQTSTIPVPAGEVTLDLNGHTLRVSDQTTLSGGQKLTLKNGSFIRQGDYNWNSLDFAVIGGASMELDGVTYTGAGFQPQGQGSTVRIANSAVVSKTYCVSTNASASANHDVKVEIENSTLKCTDADSAAILFNVPGTLTVKDSTLEGGRQALIVRGGTAELSGCELTNRAEYTNTKQYYDSSWGSGNEVPMAGLVVGNRANAYQYAATCTLTDTTITVAGTEVPDIYIYGNAEEGLGATLTYPSGTDYEIVKGGNATIIQN